MASLVNRTTLRSVRLDQQAYIIRKDAEEIAVRELTYHSPIVIEIAVPVFTVFAAAVRKLPQLIRDWSDAATAIDHGKLDRDSIRLARMRFQLMNDALRKVAEHPEVLDLLETQAKSYLFEAAGRALQGIETLELTEPDPPEHSADQPTDEHDAD